MLTNPEREAYVLPREINVTRHVTVVGNPALLPNIDAGGGGAERAFHVLVGVGVGVGVCMCAAYKGGSWTVTRGLTLNQTPTPPPQPPTTT